MKRFLGLCAVLLPCMFLIGCSDSRVDYIKGTIDLLNTATAKVGDIKRAVSKAIDKADKSKKIDLTEAMDATKGLKEVGAEAQELKRRIDKVRLQVTEEDRKTYAEKEKNVLSAAFADLLKQRMELKQELTRAEADDKNKAAVKELRAKIVDAESPFEAIAR